MKFSLYPTFGIILLSIFLSACRSSNGLEVCWKENGGQPYRLEKVIEVYGRQGIATDGTYYYVSSSTAIYKYNKEGQLIQSNKHPFERLQLPANHIGDIDVADGNIYMGIETFIDGKGENIQVAVYDTETLRYKHSIVWDSRSGQVEVCGLAVDKEKGIVWMADWVQGHELYAYDLNQRTYLGKVELSPTPHLQQGICCRDGHIIISCDDGDAEQLQPDHLYIVDARKMKFSPNPYQPSAVLPVKTWRTMTDFRRMGEIEGLTIDPSNSQLLVLANRGARIILGMPKGFYNGYNREIHELYIYDRP